MKKLILIFYLMLSFFSFSQKSFKKDLEKYKGFYTSIEENSGRVSIKNLPQYILSLKQEKIENVSIDYLDKLDNGFLFLFKINYSNSKLLIISLLDKKYQLSDYKYFPDGNTENIFKQDTITATIFSKENVDVLLMHPNKYEEPDFRTDGILKKTLKIKEDLTFKEQ